MSQRQNSETLFWLTQPHERVIFLYRNIERLNGLVTLMLREAQETGLHFVALDGAKLATMTQLALQIEQLYQFPLQAYDKHEPKVRWDGIKDWLADLTWINGHNKAESNPIKGFALMFLNPIKLYRADPVQLAIFLDVVVDAAKEHAKTNTPFHMILGPAEREFEQFLRVLRINDYIEYKD